MLIRIFAVFNVRCIYQCCTGTLFGNYMSVLPDVTYDRKAQHLLAIWLSDIKRTENRIFLLTVHLSISPVRCRVPIVYCRHVFTLLSYLLQFIYFQLEFLLFNPFNMIQFNWWNVNQFSHFKSAKMILFPC